MIISVPVQPIQQRHRRQPIRDIASKAGFTDDACTLSYTDGTVLSTDTILYGKWEKSQHRLLPVAAAPMGQNIIFCIMNPTAVQNMRMKNIKKKHSCYS